MSRASEMFGQLREEIRRWINLEVLPGLLVNTLIKATSALGNKDGFQNSDNTDDQRPVARSQPWGFQGRPVTGIRAYGIKFGSSNVIFFGIAPTTKYGNPNLEEGETNVYSAEVDKGMHLDKNGQNNINSKAGQDVVVNGGTKKVARVDDKTIADASMSSWITAITGAVNTATSGSIPAPTDFGKINEGAANFKG